MMTENLKKREQEQAYLLLTPNKTEVIKDLLERDSLGGFDLSEPVVHTIVDTYFDTPDSDLRMATVSLRKRVINGAEMITFKGVENPKSKETQDHSEWEFEWPFKIEGVDPEILFTAAGMEEVQRRDTTRVSRDLYLGDDLIGELNVDSSLYTVSTGEARLYELEIERQGKLKLKKIVKPIEAELGDTITPWFHGKFTTGKAIEFAFGVKTDDTVVTPESFFYIAKMFNELSVKK